MSPLEVTIGAVVLWGALSVLAVSLKRRIWTEHPVQDIVVEIGDGRSAEFKVLPTDSAVAIQAKADAAILRALDSRPAAG